MTIPAEAELTERVEIAIVGTHRDPAAQHLVVEAKPFSKSVVVIRHTGSATLAQNIEFLVGDSAQLSVICVQQWDDDAVHASAQYAKLGRDSRFKHVCISLGGDLVRVTPLHQVHAARGGNRNVRPLLCGRWSAYRIPPVRGSLRTEL